MSDTVYDEGDISFTRYWAGDEDGVQITFTGQSQQQGYGQMKFSDFEKAYLAVKESVEKTKDAWWHTLAGRNSS